MAKYDYSKLLGKIRERGMTQEDVAKMIGISACSLNLSLNNKRVWRQDEMLTICDVLEVPVEEVDSYFFAKEL